MKILVMVPVNERDKKIMKSIAPRAEFVHTPSYLEAKKLLGETEAVIGWLPGGLYRESSCENLRWVQLSCEDADFYAKAGIFPAGTIVTGVDRVNRTFEDLQEFYQRFMRIVFHNLHSYVAGLPMAYQVQNVVPKLPWEDIFLWMYRSITIEDERNRT